MTAEIIKISHSKPAFVKLEEDKWMTDVAFKCDITLRDIGCYSFTIDPGFKFNFRSGPSWISLFIPKIGTNWLAYLIHDSLYQCHALTKNTSDLLLLLMSEYQGNLGIIRSEIIYGAVQTSTADDAWNDITKDMADKVHFEWIDREREKIWYKTN